MDNQNELFCIDGGNDIYKYYDENQPYLPQGEGKYLDRGSRNGNPASNFYGSYWGEADSNIPGMPPQYNYGGYGRSAFEPDFNDLDQNDEDFDDPDNWSDSRNTGFELDSFGEQILIYREFESLIDAELFDDAKELAEQYFNENTESRYMKYLLDRLYSFCGLEGFSLSELSDFYNYYADPTLNNLLPAYAQIYKARCQADMSNYDTARGLIYALSDNDIISEVLYENELGLIDLKEQCEEELTLGKQVPHEGLDDFFSRIERLYAIRDGILIPETLSDLTSQPTQFELGSPYPNPFNPTVVVPFSTPRSVNVRIAVYNLMGREVALLLEKPLDAGSHEIVWNSNDERSIQVSSGTYFVKMEAEGFVKSKKIVLMK